jgi:hypothetical protein
MDDAKECNSNFMTFDTFKDVLEFNFKYDTTIIITGGEPTEHPEFWKFIDYLIEEYLKKEFVYSATITTNGMNLIKNKDVEEKISHYNDTCKNLFFQVTNDVRYYPIRVNSYERIFKYKNVTYIDRIESLYPQGRAGNNHTDNITSPKCFNLRSISRSIGFEGAVPMLRQRLHKFCTPQVIYNGDLKLGESLLCPTVATIYDSYEDINRKVQAFKCHGCDILTKNLGIKYRQAIGED